MSQDSRPLVKFVSVQRSDRAPTLHWWSLPLALRALREFAGEQLEGSRALVRPASALAAVRAELAARDVGGDVAVVADVAGLFAARDEGRVGPCTIAVFPPTIAGADLDARAHDLASDLERAPCTVAIRPDGEGPGRHWFCFRVPGKVIAAIERLAAGRAFGGNPGQVEMALLQGLALRPRQTAHLQLVLHQGAARLVGSAASGRRRVTLLESDHGYVGIYDDVPFQEALRERVREAARRFPVGVVMFAGLPLFIVAFWMASLARRRTIVPPAAATPVNRR